MEGQKKNEDFKGFVDYYNVSTEDPEAMREPEEESSIGSYSKKYLKKMLNQRGETYSVSKVNAVTTKEYIEGMEERLINTKHIKSYKNFRNFIDTL